MELKATLETKTSKSGNTYQCIVIKLTNDYEKTVFLDKAELALLKLNGVESMSSSDFPFSN